jgi:hypothetical protein
MKELCPREDAPLSGVSARVGSSGLSQEFQLGSGVPVRVKTSGRPNKKCYSALAFWITI